LSVTSPYISAISIAKVSKSALWQAAQPNLPSAHWAKLGADVVYPGFNGASEVRRFTVRFAASAVRLRMLRAALRRIGQLPRRSLKYAGWKAQGG
jgi:hypothetical protein